MKSAPARLMETSCSTATAGAVDPAALVGRLDHGVLAAHLVGADRDVNPPPDLCDHVEVGQGRLHHDHVGALGHVEVDLGQRLAPVGRILLVRTAVAATDDVTSTASRNGP